MDGLLEQVIGVLAIVVGVIIIDYLGSDRR